VDNDVVAKRAQSTQMFRCPEDMRVLGPQYKSVSDVTGTVEATSPDISQTYTFAKMVVKARSNSTYTYQCNEALEGYNWATQSIEWNSSTFVFCRRWGLRDNAVSGAASPNLVLNSVATTLWNDYNDLPGRERTLAHTPAVSIAP
jgi:hypothetical protein